MSSCIAPVLLSQPRFSAAKTRPTRITISFAEQRFNEAANARAFYRPGRNVASRGKTFRTREAVSTKNTTLFTSSLFALFTLFFQPELLNPLTHSRSLEFKGEEGYRITFSRVFHPGLASQSFAAGNESLLNGKKVRQLRRANAFPDNADS